MPAISNNATSAPHPKAWAVSEPRTGNSGFRIFAYERATAGVGTDGRRNRVARQTSAKTPSTTKQGKKDPLGCLMKPTNGGGKTPPSPPAAPTNPVTLP